MSATEYRPWGYFQILGNDLTVQPQYQVKKLLIKPGQKFSLQHHEHRKEYWLITTGHGVVTIDTMEYMASPGKTFIIPQGMKHRAANGGLENLVIIETQMGDDIREDDIVRYEDIYGRK